MLKKAKIGLLLSGLSLGLSLSVRAETALVVSAQAPEAHSEHKIALQFRPRVGQERVIRLHAVQNMTQILPRGKSTLRQTISIDTQYHVLSVDEKGRIRLRATPMATRFEREVDGKIIDRYDSANPPKKLSEEAETLALLNGFQIVLQMNLNGTIEEIEDREGLAETMMDRLKVAPENREMLRPIMIATLNGNAFKNIGNTFASFSERELNVGDSWPKRDVVSGDWNLVYDGYLSLAKNTDDQSTLHLKSVMKPDPGRKEGTYVFPVQGSQKGYYFVDNETGWTRRARLEQRWTGRLNEYGQFVGPDVKDGRALYMKMTFDVGTLSEK